MREALILYPDNPEWTPLSPALLTDTLHECGLLDKNICHQSDYEFGDAFSRMLSFLGCSPTLFSDTGKKLFSINVPPTLRDAVLIAGNLAKPRCKQCKKPVTGWQAHAVDEVLCCPACKATSMLQDLHWKKQAAFTRNPVVIKGVMEGIAVPSDELLTTLKKTSHCDWRYSYYSDSEKWPEF